MDAPSSFLLLVASLSCFPAAADRRFGESNEMSRFNYYSPPFPTPTPPSSSASPLLLLITAILQRATFPPAFLSVAGSAERLRAADRLTTTSPGQEKQTRTAGTATRQQHHSARNRETLGVGGSSHYYVT